MEKGILEIIAIVFVMFSYDEGVTRVLFNGWNYPQAIADTINTVIPWAWKEIKVSFNGITKALKKLVKNPQSAIQEIGEAIARYCVLLCTTDLLQRNVWCGVAP